MWKFGALFLLYSQCDASGCEAGGFLKHAMSFIMHVRY